MGASNFNFPVRLGLLAALLTTELVAITQWLDAGALLGAQGRMGRVGMIHEWGAWVIHVAMASVVAFLIMGESVRAPEAVTDPQPIRWRLLGAHAIAMLGLVTLSSAVFSHRTGGLIADVETGLWVVTGLVAVVLGACAIIPARIWIARMRAARDVLVFAPAAGLAAGILASAARDLWSPLSHATLLMSAAMLRPFLSETVTGQYTIGSPSFQVAISAGCSGYEGMALILAVTCACLWFTRREWIFPNALILIPTGIATIWILNAVRIAALVLIANAGAERIAVGGFHAQAGWISFSLVSLAICAGARRIAWIHKRPAEALPVVQTTSNPTAAYLMPFLGIMAAGLIARAASADFEWLYGIKVIAAVVMLWFFRKSYRELDLRFGASALGIGAVVCAMWIALDRFTSVAPSAAPAAFAQASLSAQSAWIALRIIGAVITVPIAEELAFRGFLLRRLADTNFEFISLKAVRWMPFVVSSLAFGLLHGERWLAGTIAGMLYAAATFRRGRLGDAIAAHAFTNLLLAGFVLVTGNWQFW